MKLRPKSILSLLVAAVIVAAVSHKIFLFTH